MIKNEIFSIGVMSGTSLDGVDLIYCSFNKNKYKDFKIICAKTIPYSSIWLKDLKNAIVFSKAKLKELNIVYGRYLGEIINSFIQEFKINKVDFIASHGHTVLHQPENGITLQIGSGEEIAKITDQKVVSDFRTQDVKLGGQGAPLVPIGDELLFSKYDFCLNLGGFSNVSFNKKKLRIAFDICPVNIVLNFYANKLGLDYDDSGKIASEGKINQQLLNKLNSLEYYQKESPKSLGLEWVQKEIFPLIDSLENNIENVLRTFVEHIAVQISKVISNSNSVLVTGGGAFNTFLIERIENQSKNIISLPNHSLIHYKEALIFAFLGLLKINNEVNCLKSVTGALKDHSSGVIVFP